jgi:hypothetical protein
VYKNRSCLSSCCYEFFVIEPIKNKFQTGEQKYPEIPTTIIFPCMFLTANEPSYVLQWFSREGILNERWRFPEKCRKIRGARAMLCSSTYWIDHTIILINMNTDVEGRREALRQHLRCISNTGFVNGFPLPVRSSVILTMPIFAR